MTRRIVFAVMALAAFTAEPAWTQQGPHVHGAGELKVAVEGNTLHVIWESPLANLVGFEHAPKMPDEHAATRRMEDQARDFARLFRTPSPAGCTLAEVVLHSTGEETATEAHGRGHDEKHVEKPTAEKGHGHSETHAELLAEYKVTCRDIKALDHLDVMVFDVFPGTEILKAEIVTDAGQGAVTLMPKSRRIGLK